MKLKGNPVVEFIAAKLAQPDPDPIALSKLREINEDFGDVLQALKSEGLEFEIFESPPDSNRFFLEIQAGHDLLLEAEAAEESSEPAPHEPEILRFEARKLNLSKMKSGDIKFSCYAAENQKELAGFVIDCDEEFDVIRVEVMRIPEGRVSGAGTEEEVQNAPADQPEEDSDLDSIMQPADTAEPQPEPIEQPDEPSPEEAAKLAKKRKEAEIRENPDLSPAQKEATLNLMRGYGSSDAGKRKTQI